MSRMRISLKVVRLAAAMSLLTAATAFAQNPKNLIVNGSFETPLADHPWMPAGWDTSRAGTETVFFGRDAFSAHSGSFGISVANASALYPFAHNWSQTLLATPDMWGKDLVFSVWTRNNGVDGRAYVLLQAYRDTVSKMARIWKIDREDAGMRLRMPGVADPLLDLAWDRMVFHEFESDWVRREVRVHVAPTTNMVYMRLGLIGTGQVIFDDASLMLVDAAPRPTPAPMTNLLQDPGFEQGAWEWELSMPPYPSMHAELDSAVVHGGRVSMRFSGAYGMIAGRAGVSQSLDGRGFAGKRLRMTGWMRAESLKTSASVKLFCHTTTGMLQETSSRTVSGTTDWAPVTVEMDIPPDTYEVWAWMMYAAPIPGRIWFDDAELVVLGPATGKPTPVQPPVPELTSPPAKTSRSSRGS